MSSQISGQMGGVVPAEFFIGFGTVANVVAVIVGSAIGMALAGRFSPSTRSLVTDVLGLLTMVVGASSIAPLFDDNLAAAVGSSLVFVVIMMSLIGGTLIGAALRIERRLDRLGDRLIESAGKRQGTEVTAENSARFTQGFVGASLLFCVGPMAVLGSLSDGLGLGPDQLLAKSMLDFFAAMAFASSLGWGVMVSAVSVAVFQGTLTVLGAFLGDLFSVAQIDALSITGGIMLLGLSIRLLELKPVRVADMLPALAIAPLLVWVIGLF